MTKKKPKKESRLDWFESKHGCPPPELDTKELQAYKDQTRFGSERDEQWVADTIDFYRAAESNPQLKTDLVKRRAKREKAFKKDLGLK